MGISIKENVAVGFSDFWSRKVRSFITILGIVLGTMSIIVVLSLMKAINEQSIAWLQERGGLSKISVYRNWQYESKENVKNYFTIKDVLYIKNLLPQARLFNPVLWQYFSMNYEKEIYSGSVNGVLPDFTGIEEWDVEEGRFFTDYDVKEANSVIVIGSHVKKQLFGNKKAVGNYISINNIRMKVIGVMKHRYFKGNDIGNENILDYLNYRSFMPISTIVKRFSTEDRIYSFDVKSASLENTETLRDELENIIMNLTRGHPVFDVESSKSRAENMEKDTMTFRIVFSMISTISLFVGGIVIMNIMLATVKERTREIGVRIAVGARKRDIFLQFLIQTVLATSSGGILGVLLGTSILNYVGNFMDMNLQINVNIIIFSILVASGVGMLFGIIPALNASRMDPVKALRYE
ncbi:MAG: ABC transporter permease [Candidatus Cloacimonetes bacterium]|nr:ABC transporter permease [Candidatus Cloacimonadota bacterium]